MSSRPAGSCTPCRTRVVNIARDVARPLGTLPLFYRNDVVLYRREGLSGWLWLLAKDSWHTVQVLRDRQGCRAERIKIIWKGFAAGVRFRPQIPYLHEPDKTNLP